MNELIKKLQSDEAFAEEFKAYLAGAANPMQYRPITYCIMRKYLTW